MRNFLLLLTILCLSFLYGNVLAQLPVCIDNVEGNYVDYANTMDLLYEVETQNVCITEMLPVPGDPDYMTAHTSRVDVYGDVIIDEAVNLDKIFMLPGDCGGVWDIESIFININIPDPDLPTLTDTNYETIYDIRRTNDPNFIVGVGVYYELAVCTGASGGLGGGDPTTHISIPWPFYFKFDVVHNSFVYFKRLKKPGTNSCGKIPVDAIPTDIEILNDSRFVICLSEGTDRGLVRVNSNTGAVVNSKKYGHDNNQYFDPVDVEVYGNRIYAVGKVQLPPFNTFVPALLSTNHSLTGLRLKYYGGPAATHKTDNLKMSAVKANPESNSLLLTGWILDGTGAILAIHVDELVSLEMEWQNVIRATLPSGGIHTFGETFGLEALHKSDLFTLHVSGLEIYGLDGKVGHYLVTIGSDVGDPVKINDIFNPFLFDDENPVPANNTLVQSLETGNLGLVLHSDEEGDPLVPISLLNTNLSSNTEECLGELDPDVETIDAETHSVPGFYTTSNTIQREHVQLAVVEVVDVNFEEKCHTIPGGGPGGGLKSDVGENDQFTISNHNSNPDFHVFPNPATSVINLDVQGDYQVFDLNGRLRIEIRQGNTIDVSSLSPGLYLIRNGLGTVKKLIVN